MPECRETAERMVAKMKNYKSTKFWAIAVSDISENIDSNIKYLEDEIQKRKLDVANEEPDRDTDWKLEVIEELEEKVKAYKWALNVINAPFKIKQ
jgi:gas vesicle protein